MQFTRCLVILPLLLVNILTRPPFGGMKSLLEFSVLFSVNLATCCTVLGGRDPMKPRHKMNIMKTSSHLCCLYLGLAATLFTAAVQAAGNSRVYVVFKEG